MRDQGVQTHDGIRLVTEEVGEREWNGGEEQPHEGPKDHIGSVDIINHGEIGSTAQGQHDQSQSLREEMHSVTCGYAKWKEEGKG